MDRQSNDDLNDDLDDLDDTDPPAAAGGAAGGRSLAAQMAALDAAAGPALAGYLLGRRDADRDALAVILDPLVRVVAARLHKLIHPDARARFDRDDVEQHARIALLTEVLPAYDGKRGAPLTAFVTTRLRQRTIDHLRPLGAMVRPERATAAKTYSLDRAAPCVPANFNADGGRRVSAPVAVGGWDEALADRDRSADLDHFRGVDGEGATADERFEAAVLARLAPEHREPARLRWFEGQPLYRVASALGLSRERTRPLLEEAKLAICELLGVPAAGVGGGMGGLAF